jgi:hypothetical protein
MEKCKNGEKNLNKKLMVLLPVLILLTGAIFNTQIVSGAGSDLPLVPKHTFTGVTLTAVDSTYHSKDYTIVSGSALTLDKIVEGLILPDDDCYVDLDETSLRGDSAIDSSSDFSPGFINSTYNAGIKSSAVDVLIDAELSAAYSDTRMDAEVTFNTSGAETAYWRTLLATDVNGDGDYEDSADKTYRTSLGKSGQIIYWSIMADWNVSDTDNFLELTFSFKTTGSSNYDFEIFYYTGTGDSAWSNVDSAGEDKVTVSLYDTDAKQIAEMAGMDDLLEMDLGDNPVISGLDYVEIRVGTDNAAANVLVRINNLAFFSDFPAITDNTDNSDDWDIDGTTGGLWDGVWDDNDFLITSIVEGTNEVYDSTVPLKDKIEVSPYTMLIDARKIRFGGNVYVKPSGTASSVANDAGGYITTENWKYDSTALDDLQTPANIFTWTDSYYNMTLKQDVLWNDYEDFEDDLISFEMEDTDKVENLRSLWDAADEDNYKVAYDGTNPDSTTGSSYDFTIKYHTDSSYTVSIGTVSGGTDDVLVIIFGVTFLLACAALVYMFLTRKKK